MNLKPINKTIRVKNSDIHAKGVFAKRDIKKDEYIIRYLGKKLTYAQAKKKHSEYYFELNNRYKIDGRNQARYINHSCEPNCYIDIVKGEIWILALKDIKRGEELTYNYGFNLTESKKYPCHCGKTKCVGVILDDAYWHRLKN